MARLTADYVRAMFNAMAAPPPPVLTLDEAASLVRMAPDTLKHMVCDRRLRKSVKRGKPLLFLRDALVVEVMGLNDSLAPRRPPPKSDSTSQSL